MPTVALGDSSTRDTCPSVPRQMDSSTHGVEEHCQEQFAPIDDFVQLTGATRVFVVEDGVREEAAGLPGEYLGQEKDRDGACTAGSSSTSKTKRASSTPQGSGLAPLPLTTFDFNPDDHKGRRWTDGGIRKCPHTNSPHAGETQDTAPSNQSIRAALKPPAEVLGYGGGGGREKHKR